MEHSEMLLLLRDGARMTGLKPGPTTEDCGLWGSASVEPGQIYRRVKVSSMVMMTGTGSPCRMPGTNFHCRAAFSAS